MFRFGGGGEGRRAGAASDRGQELPHAGSGKKLKEEGATEKKHFELTAAPVPCACWGEKGRGKRTETGVEVGKKGAGKKVFLILFSVLTVLLCY